MTRNEFRVTAKRDVGSIKPGDRRPKPGACYDAPMALFNAWSDVRCPVIGMIHLPPLPGSPRAAGSIVEVTSAALADAEALAAGGVDGVMIENFGDVPFYPDCVPPQTVAAMTAVAVEVRRQFGGPIGINVLRNDAIGALAVALAARADFIRVNILAGTRSTDQGLITGSAHELMRWRRYLGAGAVQVLADIDVKHSAALTPIPLADAVAETVFRAGADGLIVSGSGTGRAVNTDDLQAVQAAAAGVPIFLGSGVTEGNVSGQTRWADGIIVGTALKRDGQVLAPVDAQRVAGMVQAVRRATQ